MHTEKLSRLIAVASFRIFMSFKQREGDEAKQNEEKQLALQEPRGRDESRVVHGWFCHMRVNKWDINALHSKKKSIIRLEAPMWNISFSLACLNQSITMGFRGLRYFDKYFVTSLRYIPCGFGASDKGLVLMKIKKPLLSKCAPFAQYLQDLLRGVWVRLKRPLLRIKDARSL